MIKIRINKAEFTIEGTRWSGELVNVVGTLNRLSALRPFHYERRPERDIAEYIVAEFNQEEGVEAEIIYDSKAGQPAPVYDPNMKL